MVKRFAAGRERPADGTAQAVPHATRSSMAEAAAFTVAAGKESTA
jgi:hypothetical protein